MTQLRMKVWVEIVGADEVPQHREIAIVERIVDGARLGDFGLSLEEGKVIQRRLQEEFTQIQGIKPASRIGNVPNATACAGFMTIGLAWSILSSAFVACAYLGSAAVPAEGRQARTPETSRPC